MMPRAYSRLANACPNFHIEFVDPENKALLRRFVDDLTRTEYGYFKHMRFNNKPGSMTPHKFVECIRPWTPGDMEMLSNHVLPDVKRAAQSILDRIDDTTGTCVANRVPVIWLARLDPALENGFPFTLSKIVFMPTVPRHVPNPNNIDWLRKTILHEVTHILQRHFIVRFHRFYTNQGFVRIPRECIEAARDVAKEMGYEPISNPDTWKAYLYGLPLDAKHTCILFTNLAVDGPNYREMAFYWYPRTRLVEGRGWLSETAEELLQSWTIPQQTKEALLIMHSVSELEGHPHEIYSRVWENLI